MAKPPLSAVVIATRLGSGMVASVSPLLLLESRHFFPTAMFFEAELHFLDMENSCALG